MKSAKLEKQTEKPKYGMWSNSAYMIRLAWTVCRSVLWLCLLQAALAVAANLLELFIAPAVLGAIEKAVPLRQLLWTIFIFAGGLVLTGALSSYVNENTLFGRIEVRLKLIAYIRDKYAMTSYPNTGNQKILKLLENAQRAVGGNRDAGEAIWTTLTSLLQNAVGFLIYLAMLDVYKRQKHLRCRNRRIIYHPRSQHRTRMIGGMKGFRANSVSGPNIGKSGYRAQIPGRRGF